MSDLEKEEKMKAGLEKEFGAAAEVSRRNRVWADVETAKLPQVMAWLRKQGFDHLATVTGFDEGENLGAYYHVTDTHVIVTVKVKTPRANPSLPSVLGTFPGALSYERELEDMLGIKVEGLPPGRRYPLDENFPRDQYPLRKDWKVEDYLAKNPIVPTEAK